jgi:1-acyl-sn-glycerol-3-phosphate acyltransferase
VTSLSPTLYRCLQWLIRRTLGRWFVLDVEGLAYLPAAGPVIVCPKHQRWEDIPLLGAALPGAMHYIAKVELFQRPLQRQFLLALGGVPVDRDHPRATLSSFKRLAPLLQNGAAVVLFPEGTYVRGGVGPGKHRLIQMLLRLQTQPGIGALPFVPVGVRYEKQSCGYRVAIRLGPPLLTRHSSQARALTDKLMAEIARLSQAGDF